MTVGRFIAFEGGEGSGKSTQARLLAQWLAQEGYDLVLTREPGGTSGAEAIRELLLHPPGDDWGSRSEALLFAAARSDHVEKLIAPAIAAGRWVICDRFLDSSRAYQGAAGGVGDQEIVRLHDIGSGGLLPDLTVLLAVRTEDSTDRLAKRDAGSSDAIGGRGAEYHARVAAAFQRIADREPGRFVVIDGGGSVEAVHGAVRQAIAVFFGIDS